MHLCKQGDSRKESRELGTGTKCVGVQKIHKAKVFRLWRVRRSVIRRAVRPKGGEPALYQATRQRSKALNMSVSWCQSWLTYASICLSVSLSYTQLSNYYIVINKWYIGIMVRVFANGPGDRGSIPGRVIPKTLKMVLDASLLNTQHYKVGIKGKVEKSRERSSALPYTLV